MRVLTDLRLAKLKNCCVHALLQAILAFACRPMNTCDTQDMHVISYVYSTWLATLPMRYIAEGTVAVVEKSSDGDYTVYT